MITGSPRSGVFRLIEGEVDYIQVDAVALVCAWSALKGNWGDAASPVGLNSIEVSTYPLRVVFESAVCNWLNLGVVASSARATEARLTTPSAARPNVHLLNFIWFLRCCLFVY